MSVVRHRITDTAFETYNGPARAAGQEATMEKHYEGPATAANMEQSIILAQLQMLRNLERRRLAAGTQLPVDPITRLAA